jgi:WD40 repeat protein
VLKIDVAQENAKCVHQDHGEAEVTCIAVSADGRWLATGDAAGTIILWSLEEDRRRRKLKHGGGITCLKFSRDCSCLLASNYSRRTKIWEIEPVKMRLSIKIGYSFGVFVLDDEYIVDCGGGGQGRLRLVSAVTGQLSERYPHEARAVVPVSVGDEVVTISLSDRIQVFRLPSGEQLQDVEIEGGRPVVMTMAGNGSRLGVVVSREKGRGRSARWSTREVRVFDPTALGAGGLGVTGNQDIRSIALSGDGRLLATGGTKEGKNPPQVEVRFVGSP